MYDKPLTNEQILTLLTTAPSRLDELSGGLSPAQLVTSPEPEQWSLRDILAHLRACSDMWGGYIARILHEDHPTLKAVNPTTWIRHTDYCELEFRPSFRAYADQRAGLVRVLEVLKPEDWDRAATVTGAGKPRERTVYTYAEWLASHERSHFRQIKNAADRVRDAEQQP